MQLELSVFILVGLLFILLAGGLEIAVVLGVCGLTGVLLLLHQPPFVFARISWGVSYSFILTAVPLFIFMGEIFLNSGISERLFEGLAKWVGSLPGGLASTVVVACGTFAAISGSSPATAATIGAFSLPEMEKRGYERRLAYGVLAAGGTLGILIPPSVTMIIYGSWAGVSVVELFKAGLIPGIVLAGLFIIMIMVRVKLRPSLAPRLPTAPLRERLIALGDIVPWFLIIGAVLGGIMLGITTPTEAAAVGVICALLASLAYRRLSFNVIKKSALASVQLTCMIMLLIFGAKLFAYVFLYLQVPTIVAGALLALTVSKYVIIASICAVYLILGCIFDPLSMLVLTMPFVIPIVTKLGFDLVWFGVIFVICAEAGMITPPVGFNLYVLQGLDKRATLGEVARGSLPFLAMMVVMIAIIVAFPQIALWLPSLG